MTAAGTYRRGMLSTLLLGNGEGDMVNANTESYGTDTGINGGTGEVEKAHEESESSVTRAAKKSKKTMKLKNGEEMLAVKPSLDEPSERESPTINVDANLSSLFSTKNLKKFKRKDRADKEEDAAEVARITEEARDRERRAAEKEASAGKMNKKAKKREAEREEARRKQEEERRATRKAKRLVALVEAGVVKAPGKKQATELAVNPPLEAAEETKGRRGAGRGSDGGDRPEARGARGGDSKVVGPRRKRADEDEDEEDPMSEPESIAAGEDDNSDDEEAEHGRDRSDASGGDESDGKAVKAEGKENDKQEKDACTIFVGNLPIDTQSKKVKTLFKSYGAIESVRLRSVAVEGTAVGTAGDQRLVRKVCVNSGKLAGEVKDNVNAYVVFKNMETAEKALAANGMEVGGKHIRVDRAATPDFDHARSVFLGNLPLKIGEEEVRSAFSAKLEGGHAAVQGVRLIRNKETLIGKGVGYVLLADRAIAAAALALNGTKIGGRVIRVKPCGKRTKGRHGEVKPGEDVRANRFASTNFEGRRAKGVSEGALRRIQERALREGQTTPSGPDASRAPSMRQNGGTSSTKRNRVGIGSSAVNPGPSASDEVVRPGKKPRWTTEDGVRAGKAAGGRPAKGRGQSLDGGRDGRGGRGDRVGRHSRENEARGRGARRAVGGRGGMQSRVGRGDRAGRGGRGRMGGRVGRRDER